MARLGFHRDPRLNLISAFSIKGRFLPSGFFVQNCDACPYSDLQAAQNSATPM